MVSLYVANEEGVYELETVWHGERQSESVDSLPAVFAHDENGTTTVYTTIDEKWMEQGNTLCFRASQEAVRVWIDGSLVLEQGNLDIGIFGQAPSSGWVMFRLPADSGGKELRIDTDTYSEHQSHTDACTQTAVHTLSQSCPIILRCHGCHSR